MILSRRFFKNSFSVYRLSSNGTTEEYSFIGTNAGLFVNASPEDAMISEGNPAASVVLLTTKEADIKTVDKIIYDNDTYIVAGVKNAGRLFGLAYKRCVLQKPIS